MPVANAVAESNPKRSKTITKTDALEMLGADLGLLVQSGMRLEHTCEGGVLTVRVFGVAEARDAEGVYFVPAAVVASTQPVPA